MENIFIENENYRRFESLCRDLLAVVRGVDMGVILGRAGRGKTTAALRFATMNPLAVYVAVAEWHTVTGLLREIAFGLSSVKPRTSQACLEAIEDGFSKGRRLLLVDEADRLCLKRINALRNLNDRYGVPVMMIGETPLDAKVKSERRLISRVRETLEFDPADGDDVFIYFRDALGLDIPGETADKIARHAQGDFRMIVKDALKIERLMATNGLKSITPALLEKVIGK